MTAADKFANDTGVQLTAPGFIPLPSEKKMYGASPDHVFTGEKCNQLHKVGTGIIISVPPKYLLEIKTQSRRLE